jgi:hypothetical protein
MFDTNQGSSLGKKRGSLNS